MAGNYHGGWIGAKGFPNTTHGRARGKRYSATAESGDNRCGALAMHALRDGFHIHFR
jgi:hypothetical protein